MNYDEDVLFGAYGDPLDDQFQCGSPLGVGGGDSSLISDHFRTDLDPQSPSMHELSGIPYHDNSLTVPMDDYQFSNELGMSKDFQTLQTAQSMPSTSYQEMSSMSMSYSNGTEISSYESVSMSNGVDMMGVGTDHMEYDMNIKPSTSYSNQQYQPSPSVTEHESPSVSRSHSRPSSRAKGGGSSIDINGGGGNNNNSRGGSLQHMLNTPSSSGYQPSSAPLPVKTIPVSNNTPSTSKQRQRPSNGRKKPQQPQNTVGAVLSKANKLAVNPTSASKSVTLSEENNKLIAQFTAEIASYGNNPDHPRVKALNDKIRSIFFSALATQASTSPVPQTLPTLPTRNRTNRKTVVPRSPVYSPQCGSNYTNGADIMERGYSTIPSNQYNQSMINSGGVTQRNSYKMDGIPSSTRPSSTGSTIFIQNLHNNNGGGQPTRMNSAQRVMVKVSAQEPSSSIPSSSSSPSISSSPLITSHPPGTTVRAALKGSTMKRGGGVYAALQQQQSISSSSSQILLGSCESTAPLPPPSASQPSLLTLSLPVSSTPCTSSISSYQSSSHLLPSSSHLHPPRPSSSSSLPPPIPIPYSPAQCTRKIEEKRISRINRLHNCFSVMADEMSRPRTEDPFIDEGDIFRRLIPYHLCDEDDMSEEIIDRFETDYLRTMIDLDERRRKVEDGMRKILYKEAMAEHDDERNLLLFLDYEYERTLLEEEKKIAVEYPDSLLETYKRTSCSLSQSSLPSPSTQLSSLLPPSNGIVNPSLYQYHTFIPRYREPTPPPPPPSQSVLEDEDDDEDEDEDVESTDESVSPEMGIVHDDDIIPSKKEKDMVYLSSKYRLNEEKMRIEEEKKKEEDRRRKEEEEERRKEEEERRKEDDRRKKEEERRRKEEDRRRKEEEEKRRINMEEEKRRKEEKDRMIREEEERIKRIEIDDKKIVMPFKIRWKMRAREEEEKEKKVDDDRNGYDEKKKKDKKKKKKKRKHEQENEDDNEEERQRKKMKKEKKRLRLLEESTPNHVSIPSPTVVPKIKIKLPIQPSPTVIPPSTTVIPPSSTVHPPIPRITVRPPSKPEETSTPLPPPPSTPPLIIPKLKIKLGGLRVGSSPINIDSSPSNTKSPNHRHHHKHHHHRNHNNIPIPSIPIPIPIPPSLPISTPIVAPMNESIMSSSCTLQSPSLSSSSSSIHNRLLSPIPSSTTTTTSHQHHSMYIPSTPSMIPHLPTILPPLIHSNGQSTVISSSSIGISSSLPPPPSIIMSSSSGSSNGPTKDDDNLVFTDSEGEEEQRADSLHKSAESVLNRAAALFFQH